MRPRLHMEPRWPRRTVATGAILLGAVVFSQTFSSFPLPGWIFSWAFVASVWRLLYPDAYQTTTGYQIGLLLYAAAVAAAYWGIARPLRLSGNLYPRRSIVLAALIAVLSLVYFIVSWRYGLTYQGAGLLWRYALTNFVAIVLLALGWQRFHKSGRWWPSFWLHWFLLAWALLLAFPWLGEMI